MSVTRNTLTNLLSLSPYNCLKNILSYQHQLSTHYATPPQAPIFGSSDVEDEEDEVAEEVEMTETRNEERRREEENNEERRRRYRVDRSEEVRRLFWELRELEGELVVLRGEREEAERRRVELEKRKVQVQRGISMRRRGRMAGELSDEEEGQRI